MTGPSVSTIKMTHRLRGLLRRAPATSPQRPVLVAALWAVRLRADSWWPATLLMPRARWIFALPLVVLFSLAIYRRSIRLVLVLLVSAGVGLAVAGLQPSVANDRRFAAAGMPFRVATLNMHYSKGDVPEVEGLIGSTWPDVIAIQEWIGSRDSALRAIRRGTSMPVRIFISPAGTRFSASSISVTRSGRLVGSGGLI